MVRVPEEMSADAWDLINKLLTVNPEERLGMNGNAHGKESV